MIGKTVLPVIGLILFLSWFRAAAQVAVDYDTLVRQGNGQLQGGNNEQALSSATTAIKTNVNRWEAYAVAGGALMNLKRYEEAADQFSLAIQHAPETKQQELRDLRKKCLMAESGASSTSITATTSTASQVRPTTQAEIVLWKTIEHTDNIADIRGYLQQYPRGAYVLLARNRLNDLATEQADKLVNQGIEQTNRGDYAAALDSFTETCDVNNSRGCDNLGVLYFNGRGVPRDYIRAAQLYQKGCDGGDATGCSALSVMYMNGWGIPKDEVRASQLDQKARQLQSSDPASRTKVDNYAQACGTNSAEACFDLGTSYQYGKGVPQDFARAAQLYQLACDGKVGQACMNLSVLYSGGIGVAKDPSRAEQILEIACGGRYGKACTWLANNSTDTHRKLQFWQKGCDDGDPDGCANLALAHSQQSARFGLSKDDALAHQYFQRACKLGSTGYCVM